MVINRKKVSILIVSTVLIFSSVASIPIIALAQTFNEDLLLSGTYQIGFNNAGEAINSPSNGYLAIESRGLIELYGDTNHNSATSDGIFKVFTDDVFGGSPIQLIEIQRDGKVGIGTASPTNLLTVQGGDIDLRETDGGYSAVYLDAEATVGSISVYKANTENIRLYGGDAVDSKSYIMSDKFGLGTNNPQYDLDVYGNVHFQNVNNTGKIFLGQSNALIMAESNGDICIGDCD
ncbi:hypothetical protein KC571_02690 [candidate division WWE3 bacterium]|uniref:Uncharacterized protein n=1 Tax=candidate division WWE3 bacterium TaxID=2053526 RepID=A0A955LGT4_UNCKA|nr:hypothetical protein [candidate division WWE3 bacterium]